MSSPAPECMLGEFWTLHRPTSYRRPTGIRLFARDGDDCLMVSVNTPGLAITLHFDCEEADRLAAGLAAYAAAMRASKQEAA